MRDVALDLRSAVAEAVPRLTAIDDAAAQTPRAPGKWCPKEILGHLADSAVNNHQRFLRVQLLPELVFPGYHSDEWVARQAYRDRPWSEIVELWQRLNGHVAHVIERVPEADLGKTLRIGDQPPSSLEWWMRDYVRHLRHHLAQILG
jgi:hypothetical protein